MRLDEQQIRCGRCSCREAKPDLPALELYRIKILVYVLQELGHAACGKVVVKALFYKPEGLRFDTR
jgi:hypothetical protein